jgi:hypothetical protein
MIDLLFSDPLSLLALLPMLLGATLEGGPMGILRGSVGGFTFQTWRGIQTVRQRVTPANPRTTDQQANRSRFATIAKVGSALLGVVCRPFWEGVGSVQSGYNAFCRRQMAETGPTPESSEVVVTPGEMPALQNVAAAASASDISVTWDAPPTSHALSDAPVFAAWIADDLSEAYAVELAPTAQDGAGTMPLPEDAAPDDGPIHVFAGDPSVAAPASRSTIPVQTMA